ncbi:hypothetical protein A2875_01400 [Candidatus Gottesmanbacteria bacterium RIFCSPHIGHO2_01_FULL_46_14]|uniref:Glycosyltransferase RgtA/B/C/D-like domain-containing protein n=3 Tax=Microgenomates group TaxID=1794810 RepID=A0A1F5ZRI1_9BACT|nr:MAG: hypothetical protein UU67_C0034G0007 [Candidatus Daviesbacteria bacterium GW2011_GWB1_41_5]OGG15048.1 MAG: hypothetical protein A2875_01400 [Candidatus Gottesmanbacteria bacterium RIFCSPHIGHO2_01_FULL_46_14]
MIFLYLVAAIFTFWKLPFTFFQQDEWLIIGTYLYLDKAGLDWLHRFFIYKQLTHMVPFTHFVSYTQFELFRTNFYLYGLTAITIHLINTVLVYHLSSLLLKKRVLAFIAGFLFLTTSISHQGFTWIATTIGTSVSTLFFLMSLIFFSKYLNQTTSQIRHLILSMIFFFSSLLFKETSLFGFLLFPAFWFIYKRKDFIKAKMLLIVFFPLGFLYMSVRIINVYLINKGSNMEAAFVQPGLDVYIFRLFTLPLKFISQGILPQEFIINIASNLVKFSYPLLENLNPHIAQSVGADIVSNLFSVLVIAISIIFYSKTILLSLVFISLSSLPLIFVPGKAGYNSLIDGRHLYIAEIFTSILLTVLIYAVYLRLARKKLALSIVSIIVISLILFHVGKIRGDIDQQVSIGLIRKSIINNITRLYPKLPQRVIFYIESDKAYYGLAPQDYILPFQSGFGQTLLVWYNEHGEEFPACFFEDQYLYVQVSEGYRECGGRGFGYFRKKENLKKTLREHSIPFKNIFAFKYTSSTSSISSMQLDKSDFD